MKNQEHEETEELKERELNQLLYQIRVLLSHFDGSNLRLCQAINRLGAPPLTVEGEEDIEPKEYSGSALDYLRTSVQRLELETTRLSNMCSRLEKVV